MASKASKILILSAVGGTIFGFHLALLSQREFSAWIFFNALAGGLLIYFASLMSSEKEPEQDEAKSLEDD